MGGLGRCAVDATATRQPPATHLSPPPAGAALLEPSAALPLTTCCLPRLPMSPALAAVTCGLVSCCRRLQQLTNRLLLSFFLAGATVAATA